MEKLKCNTRFYHTNIKIKKSNNVSKVSLYLYKIIHERSNLICQMFLLRRVDEDYSIVHTKINAIRNWHQLPYTLRCHDYFQKLLG